jgi:hypothetical protein
MILRIAIEMEEGILNKNVQNVNELFHNSHEGIMNSLVFHHLQKERNGSSFKLYFVFNHDDEWFVTNFTNFSSIHYNH